MVLISHFPYANNFPVQIANAYHWVFSFGDLGVRIFLVLSGFLISGILLDELQCKGSVDLRKFYLRRAYRLLPVCVVYIATLMLLDLVLIYSDSLSSYAGALSQTRNYLGVGNSATVHFWSLSVEWQFYALWPMMFILFGFGSPRKAIVGIFLIVSVVVLVRLAAPDPGAGGSVIARLLGPRGLMRYADSLVIGVAGAYLWRRLNNSSIAKFFSAGEAQVAGILLVPVMFFLDCYHAGPLLLDALRQPLIGLIMLFEIFLACSETGGILVRALSAKWLISIGVISYSLYVWHVLFLSHFFFGHSQDYSIPFLWDWRIWLVPSFVVAVASYSLLEKPFFSVRASLRRE
ncbi:acyltransferase [Cyanobium sp. ATX 6F1]|nr:acyltransferase [Cyanobium sp. ATX 6F1]